MAVAIATEQELWAEHTALSRTLAVTDACTHLAYRYEMTDCDWCQIHARLGQIERTLDRICAARMLAR